MYFARVLSLFPLYIKLSPIADTGLSVKLGAARPICDLIHDSLQSRCRLLVTLRKLIELKSGKPTERWGRKATGLRERCSYDSGVASFKVSAVIADSERRTAHAAPRPSQEYASVTGALRVLTLDGFPSTTEGRRVWQLHIRFCDAPRLQPLPS